MTAEGKKTFMTTFRLHIAGDNSVLMQKVAKELLAAIDAGRVKLPAVADAQTAKDLDLTKVENLLKMLQIREVGLIKQVGMQRRKRINPL